ncbi:hypothetical protein Tco_0961572 [Tanacetum coccineum]
MRGGEGWRVMGLNWGCRGEGFWGWVNSTLLVLAGKQVVLFNFEGGEKMVKEVGAAANIAMAEGGSVITQFLLQNGRGEGQWRLEENVQEAVHKLIMSDWCEKDDPNVLMQMVSIPDRMGPLDDMNDLRKLSETMPRVMRGKLEALIDVAQKMCIRLATFCSGSAALMALIMSAHKLLDDQVIDNNGSLHRILLFVKKELFHELPVDIVYALGLQLLLFDVSGIGKVQQLSGDGTFAMQLQENITQANPERFPSNKRTPSNIHIVQAPDAMVTTPADTICTPQHRIFLEERDDVEMVTWHPSMLYRVGRIHLEILTADFYYELEELKLFGLIAVSDKYGLLPDGGCHLSEPDFAYVPLFDVDCCDAIDMHESSITDNLRVWLLKRLMSKNQVPQGIHKQEQSPIISQGVEEQPQLAHFDDPCHELLHEVSISQGSSSNVQSS